VSTATSTSTVTCPVCGHHATLVVAYDVDRKARIDAELICDCCKCSPGDDAVQALVAD
jgi:transcription elongation factor Elf1